MIEVKDIVRLKKYYNKYSFYRVIKVEGMIKAKNISSEAEVYFKEHEIEKATLSELLAFCKETNKRLLLRWVCGDTCRKLEKIIKSLEKDYKDFNYLQDHHSYYLFYFGNLTGKEFKELSTIDVFDLDIDIDNTYANILREEKKIKIKDERIKEKVEQLKIDVKLRDYIKYKDKIYYVVMIKGDFLDLIEQAFTPLIADPPVTLLTITFKDLAEYQDSLELHLKDHTVYIDKKNVQLINLSDPIKEYSEEIKMNTLSAISLDNTEYCINNKCSTCKSEEYITRDEAKEMVEELFNKKVNNSNNKENKEMNEIKPKTTFKEAVDMLYEALKKGDQNPETNQNPEKEETKANVENLYEKWRNINTKYGGLFKDADEVEAIYINADKKVIVLKWIDGETTKAVCGPQDKFDIEAGVFLALAKRYCDYETIADCCDWEGITPDMEKGVFFNLAQDFFDIFEIKRYVNWAKKVYAKQTKKEVKKTSLDNPGEKPTNPNLGVKIKKYRG